MRMVMMVWLAIGICVFIGAAGAIILNTEPKWIITGIVGIISMVITLLVMKKQGKMWITG